MSKDSSANFYQDHKKGLMKDIRIFPIKEKKG